MKVTNTSNNTIQVAINQWGNSGDTRYFGINQNSTETWDRTDERGFVMSLKRSGSQLPYYVQSSSNITVSDDTIKDGEKTLKPLS